MLELRDLRTHFNAGDLVQADVVPAPMEKGWILTFTRRNGETVYLSLSRSEKPRVMKRLDTCQDVLRDIGFRNANWSLAC